MHEEKRGKGRPSQDKVNVHYTVDRQVAEYIDSFPSGQRSSLVNVALLEWIDKREKMREVARQALSKARQEGLGSEDAAWMAVGAVNREVREQGLFDEELTAEINAAAQEIVKDISAS